MTFLPICAHERTEPVRLKGRTRFTRCVKCGVEFGEIATPGTPPGPYTHWTERPQLDRIHQRREGLFGRQA